MKIYPTLFITLALPLIALAQIAQPSIGLKTDVEGGQKMIVASVTLQGHPLANVTVQFFVQRTFGKLLLGQDTTLDDGTAAVAYPTNLPSSLDGQLHFVGQIKSPARYKGLTASVAFSGAPRPVSKEEFPRAIWAPHAPIALMVCIFVLFGGVWMTYAFVSSQVLAIRRGTTL